MTTFSLIHYLEGDLSGHSIKVTANVVKTDTTHYIKAMFTISDDCPRINTMAKFSSIALGLIKENYKSLSFKRIGNKNFNQSDDNRNNFEKTLGLHLDNNPKTTVQNKFKELGIYGSGRGRYDQLKAKQPLRDETLEREIENIWEK